MMAELQKRCPDIRWPVDFRPEDADLFIYSETDIQAPIQRVWHHIVKATEWPNWYPNAQNVSVQNGAEGVLGEGAVILWTNFGLPMESPIIEFNPYSRVSWIGYRPGYTPEWYQTWDLVSIGSGCHVAMGEVGRGPNAIELRDAGEHAVHMRHKLWLRALKQRAET
jgi:hypothetical protein